MKKNTCISPLPMPELVDYLLGELPKPDEERVEEHIFECAECAERLEVVESIGRGIRDIVAHAYAGGIVNTEFVEKARQSGMTLREYKITPGATVSCKAGPEDFVLVRLAGECGSAEDVTVDVDFRDLEHDQAAPTVTQNVEVDRKANEILIVFPGEEVRRYPRSLWTMRAHGKVSGKDTSFGTFIMDHTP